jgi:uncharacterized protein YdeI (YjbR/CyaY-like superfamily)
MRMAGSERFQAADRARWRTWLKKNHASAAEIWLVYYKKATGKPSVSYAESVQEAICFGWIDGLKKRIDDERYCHRFSPRKESSKWTPTNVKIAQRMIAAKKMTAAGKRAFDRRVEYEPPGELKLSPEVEQALKASKKAWQNFDALSPGYRRQYVDWLMTAKREATREKRLKEAIRLLEKDQKLGMK